MIAKKIEETLNKRKEKKEKIKKTNILNYIKHNGHKSFDELGLNSVDALIFADLSYGFYPFLDIKKKVKLSEVLSRMLDTNELHSKMSNKEIVKCFDLMRKSTRYKDLKMFHYKEHFSKNNEEQFKAISIELNKKTCYISYSGTDNTLIGWKEDFNLMFMDEIPAQKDAVNYISHKMYKGYKKIYVGGHSKGGNLAMFASTFCLHDSTKKKISKVFNFDGPLVQYSHQKNEKFLEIMPKIEMFIPEGSLIGMIFICDVGQLHIVESYGSGFSQHVSTNWKISDKTYDFIYSNHISKASKTVAETIENIFSEMNLEDRKQFVNLAFDLLSNTEHETLSALIADFENSFEKAKEVFGEMSDDARKFLKSTLKIYVLDLIKALFKKSSVTELENTNTYIERIIFPI